MIFGNRIRTRALLSAWFRTSPQHRVDLGSAHFSANTFLFRKILYIMWSWNSSASFVFISLQSNYIFSCLAMVKRQLMYSAPRHLLLELSFDTSQQSARKTHIHAMKRRLPFSLLLPWCVLLLKIRNTGLQTVLQRCPAWLAKEVLQELLGFIPWHNFCQVTTLIYRILGQF